MRGAHPRTRIYSAGCDQHLHREEFGEDEVLTRGRERLPRLGETNRPDRFAAITVFQIFRQQWLNRCRVEVLKKSINDAAQYALGQTLGRGIDRSDSPKMD